MIKKQKKVYIVANFGELFLKGKNISFFEKRLLQNLKEKLGNFLEEVSFEKKAGGSFYLKISENLEEEKILEIEDIVRNTPGIVNFYRAYVCQTDLQEISKLAIELAQREVKENIKLATTTNPAYRSIKTFGIKAVRVEKNAQYSSQELGRKVGSAVWKSLNDEKNERGEITVNLGQPDLQINIKEYYHETFVFLKTEKAVGGMPIGTSGKGLVFFSGGIDSPVAAFRSMKRGLEITAVHFHAVPKTNPKSIEKVKNLVQTLQKYQPQIKLILVPIVELQQEIAQNCEEKLRLVLLRRAMLKIGEKIAQEEFGQKAFAFVTGDSLAQVASQTLENLTVVNSATDKLIIRPLIGLDKSEIMAEAQKIGTYDISILPHDDACSLFTPKSPETKAVLKYTELDEEKYDLEKVIENLFEKMEVILENKNK